MRKIGRIIPKAQYLRYPDGPRQSQPIESEDAFEMGEQPYSCLSQKQPGVLPDNGYCEVCCTAPDLLRC
jgi:hypothetical protein